MKQLLKRILLALTSMLLLVGCASGSTEPAQTDTSDPAADTTTEAVTEAPLIPAVPLTETQIANHEPVLLWPEDNIPYLLENDEKGLMPTIRAYLCDGADSAVVIFPGGG